ncbi:Zinc finger protein ZPR1 [Penicillium canariense]|uniref:Zinc finger protein ZPR1 n=1 Tax=Penicillium canariense TaxID=189055 RepID=A0A9W9HXB5_9EURO|nr:Zinc finger protein ZPR1 [Penicillium canariense]KAJ5159523.1 Zinc finger protein ZPR1 [Penicillium canariense]
MSTDAEKNAPESQFQNIGDLVERNDETGVMSVESMCMNCHENGITRILLLRVPFFKDIVVDSFYCEHCNFANNTVKPAGSISPLGIKYTLDVTCENDLQRQVIRSDAATFKLDTLGIEMPKGGEISNIEGMIQRTHESLAGEQPLRKEQAPELHDALEPLIQKLQDILDRRDDCFPFTVSLDDPTGNSWIAPNPSDKTNYRRIEYPRTHEQNEELGITAEASEQQTVNPMDMGDPEDSEIVDGQVYTLPAECPGCTRPVDLKIKKVSIPYFKDVLIMASSCAPEDGGCSYKQNEVKVGGEIPEKGRRITLKVETITDLSRDVLKSGTCALHSEDLELYLGASSISSRFTTIEGLLTAMRDQLHGNLYDLGAGGGDSMVSDDKAKWDRFFARLDQAINGELKFTIVLEDPLANSYVQDLCSPAKDPQLEVVDYERTEEEEEELGLTDMKTEGYEEDAETQEA